MKKHINTLIAAALVVTMAAAGTVSVIASEQSGETGTEAAAETETEQETELVLEEPGIMYLLDTARVRQEPSTDSETVAFCDRGSSVSVLGIIGSWYHVRLDNPAQQETETEDTSAESEKFSEAETEQVSQEAPEEGYISGELLTDSADDAQSAVEANNAEIARQQAAAAAAAAAAAQAGSSGGKTVVRRQKIEDCDGGGGTVITEYSDGTTSTSRY